MLREVPSSLAIVTSDIPVCLSVFISRRDLVHPRTFSVFTFLQLLHFGPSVFALLALYLSFFETIALSSSNAVSAISSKLE